MTYVAHPYASAATSLSSSPSKGTRSQRPKIITSSSSPASFLASSDPSPRVASSISPSPITFARASVIHISPQCGSPASSFTVCKDFRDKGNSTVRSRDEKRDRRRGLMATTETHRVAHAGLDALLRVPEVASPRAVPQPRTPQVQLVRSTTNLSVTPTIVRQPPRRATPRIDETTSLRLGNGNESDGSTSSNSSTTCAPRRASPSPSSESGSAYSTPSQPRTPVSYEFKFDDNNDFGYPTIAPLLISKANQSPSPASTLLPAIVSVGHEPTAPSAQEKRPVAEETTLRKRRSRGRFSARTAGTQRAEYLFTPLEVDTTKARCQDEEIDPPTLTGVLEEFEREALKIPPVPSLPPCSSRNSQRDEEGKKVEDNDEDESEWLDIPDYEADRFEDAEYYRADIASHLQLFSPSSSFPPLSRVSSCSKSGHQRISSNSSFTTISRWQLPPARPDSMPPPPHFHRVSEGQPPSLPPLPALPALPEVGHQGFLRRASASSLASTASNRSSRSNRSTESASGRSKRRTARRSVARRSAAAALGSRRRRSSGGLSVNRPLPPIPDEEKEGQRRGPNAVLDPTYCNLIEEPENEVRPRPPRSRPPPRFSIPVSVDEDDFGSESLSPVAGVPGGGLGLMTRVVEEDEDEDGLIDPFVLERYSIAGASHCNPAHGGGPSEREGIDPFTTPPQTGRSNSAKVSVALSPSTCSPFSPSEHSQQSRGRFLAVPESPAPSSTFGGSVAGSSNSGETSLTFDAQSLYSSYAGFSPTPSSSFASSCNAGDTDSSLVCERKESAQSVYLDSSGRPLQSRWSVSTFASVAPPNTSSSSKSFFPIPKLVSTVPSRLSARLRAAREKAVQQSREKEGKEQPPVVRPFPFFPTPTPPSPKRKTNPGPGKYVPKPELMPPKERAKLGESVKSAGSPRSSIDTVKTSSTSSASSTHSSFSTSTKTRERANTANSSSSQRPPSVFKAQFAQYHAHKQSNVQGAPAYARSVSPTSTRVFSPGFTSSPKSGRASLKSRSSTDSLSAFPFLIGGESLNLLSSGAGNAPPSSSTCSVDSMNENERSRADSGGLRRKAIPPELFCVNSCSN